MKDIKYQVMVEVDRGTKEKPEIVQIFTDKGTICRDDELDDKLAAIREISYNGEYTIVDIPETEDEALAKRDKLLADTDWTQTLDAPIDEATKTAYRAYRQALRDIPQQEGFPGTINWPELPSKTKSDPEPVDEAVELLLSGATGEEGAE